MKRKLAGLLLLGMASVAYADTDFTAEFFASNNTHEITPFAAYARLTGKEQRYLHDKISAVMQRYHIEQGESGNVLGVYRMSKDKDITADNTEYVYVSRTQELTESKIFSVAEVLAMTLHQDSVAVLIPDSPSVGEVSVYFTSPQPSIPALIHTIHKKLPGLPSQGFSLHIENTNHGFKNATVSEVDWLGSKVNRDKIKHAFPGQKITTQNGSAYLIYGNGRKEKL